MHDIGLEPGTTKNDEGRTIFLDEELMALLTQLKRHRKKNHHNSSQSKLLPYVFLNEDGTDKVKSFRKTWHTACKNIGLGGRLFHDFRRTAVRNMIRSGIPERVAMMISGHKTRNVFDRYNIVSDEDLKEAAKGQEEYLKSQKNNHKIITITKSKPVSI